jgi:PKD repeat protein
LAFWRSERAAAAGPAAFSFTDLSYFQPVWWHWDFGDGTASGEPSLLHEYPAPGTYEVCLAVCGAQGLCDTLCRPVEVLAVGAGEAPAQGGLKVWPNPATGKVEIALPGGGGWEELRVHTAAGVLVRAFEGITDGENLTFEVGGWPAGVYFVSAMSRERGVLTARLVVQRE